VKKTFLLIKTVAIFILFFQTNAFSQSKNLPKKDSVKLTNSVKGKSLTKKGKTELSLFGSMNLSNQQIDDKNLDGSFNYLFDEVNSNSYQSGYSGGFRIDRITKKNRQVGMVLSINRVIAGNYYINKHTVAPFFENFTHHKADNQFTTVSLATHIKPLLIKGIKHQLHLVLGPSFDYRISDYSSNSLVNSTGRTAFVNGDIGAEFDNNGYYILFTHYKYGQEIFNTNIPVRLSRIEVGISIKVKDLF